MKKLLVTAIIGLAVGFGTADLVGTGEQEPYCPTEDSCSIDYKNGHWKIEEIVP